MVTVEHRPCPTCGLSEHVLTASCDGCGKTTTGPKTWLDPLGQMQSTWTPDGWFRLSVGERGAVVCSTDCTKPALAKLREG